MSDDVPHLLGMADIAFGFLPDLQLPILRYGRYGFGRPRVDLAFSIGLFDRTSERGQLHALANVTLGDTEVGCDGWSVLSFAAGQFRKGFCFIQRMHRFASKVLAQR